MLRSLVDWLAISVFVFSAHQGITVLVGDPRITVANDPVAAIELLDGESFVPEGRNLGGLEGLHRPLEEEVGGVWGFVDPKDRAFIDFALHLLQLREHAGVNDFLFVFALELDIRFGGYFATSAGLHCGHASSELVVTFDDESNDVTNIGRALHLFFREEGLEQAGTRIREGADVVVAFDLRAVFFFDRDYGGLDAAEADDCCDFARLNGQGVVCWRFHITMREHGFPSRLHAL